MNYTGKRVFLFFIFSLLICGCISAKNRYRKINYYTFEYETPGFFGYQPLPFVIRFDRFRVAPQYNTSNIIYQEKKFKRNAYDDHKWRAHPGELVAYFLARDFKQSSLFRGVFAPNTRFPSSHLIEGIIDDFYELHAKNHWEAVLSIDITLINLKEPDISKKILFQKRYHTKEVCDQKNTRAFMEAMSKAMLRVSQMIISDIYNTLKKVNES